MYLTRLFGFGSFCRHQLHFSKIVWHLWDFNVNFSYSKRPATAIWVKYTCGSHILRYYIQSVCCAAYMLTSSKKWSTVELHWLLVVDLLCEYNIVVIILRVDISETKLNFTTSSATGLVVVLISSHNMTYISCTGRCIFFYNKQCRCVCVSACVHFYIVCQMERYLSAIIWTKIPFTTALSSGPSIIVDVSVAFHTYRRNITYENNKRSMLLWRLSTP